VTGMAAKPRRRQRLAPDARRTQIMDQAARIVIEEGLSAVSMERLGRDCEISKALVYNYFPSREVLLTALLHREQTELRDRGMEEALVAESFADLIRQTTRLYLEQTLARGALIQALLADPSVARLMEKSLRDERDMVFRYFVKQVRKTYDLPPAMASVATELLSAVTDRAGKLLSDGAIDLPTAIELCVQLITGGLSTLARKSRARR